MMRQGPIPYETMARDIVQEDILNPAIEALDIPDNMRWKMKEWLVHTYLSGLQDGFDISDFAGHYPASCSSHTQPEQI